MSELKPCPFPNCGATIELCARGTLARCPVHTGWVNTTAWNQRAVTHREAELKRELERANSAHSEVVAHCAAINTRNATLAEESDKLRAIVAELVKELRLIIPMDTISGAAKARALAKAKEAARARAGNPQRDVFGGNGDFHRARSGRPAISDLRDQEKAAEIPEP